MTGRHGGTLYDVLCLCPDRKKTGLEREYLSFNESELSFVSGLRDMLVTVRVTKAAKRGSESDRRDSKTAGWASETDKQKHYRPPDRPMAGRIL